MELGARCGVEDEVEATRSQGRGTRVPLVDAGAWRRGSGGMEQREGGSAGWVDWAGGWIGGIPRKMRERVAVARRIPRN